MTLAVRVPGSSANMGPGFDVLAMAVSIYGELGIVDPSAQSHGQIATTNHPANVAFVRAGGIGEVWVDSPIPSGRGLGFSAAMRVGGVALGLAQHRGIAETEFAQFIDASRGELVELAAELEGHYDNAAASVWGGVVSASPERVALIPLAASMRSDVCVLVWIPQFQTATSKSRRNLPDAVRRQDAIFNIARATQLVIALSTGDFDLLPSTASDQLHQEVRLSDTPMCAEVMSALVNAGALSSWLSGSGPTVAAFARRTNVEEVAAQVGRDFPLGRTQILDIDVRGIHSI